MRGPQTLQGGIFSYVSLESRIPEDHPLRAIRRLVDAALEQLSRRFDGIYAKGVGRPSVPPEQLLRALLLQVLYTIRSERQLIEQIDYNLLYRWFVGLELDIAPRPVGGPRYNHLRPPESWVTLCRLLKNSSSKGTFEGSPKGEM